MPYPKFFPLKKCPGASVPAQANGTCPRQQGAPEAEVRATRGGGSTPTSAGCGCGGCGAPEFPGEHVRHEAPGRTDTQPGPYRALFGARTQTHPEGRGPRWVSVRRPGAGGSATPPPQAITVRGVRAGEQGVERARSLGTSVVISQHGPRLRELEGGIEGARRRRRPPAHPAPYATRRGPGPWGGAGWRAWPYNAVQGPGPLTLRLGDGCLGGHLRDYGSWESLSGDFTWL